MREIKLKSGDITLVDDEDYKFLSSISWYLLTTISGNKYAINSSLLFLTKLMKINC